MIETPHWSHTQKIMLPVFFANFHHLWVGSFAYVNSDLFLKRCAYYPKKVVASYWNVSDLEKWCGALISGSSRRQMDASLWMWGHPGSAQEDPAQPSSSPSSQDPGMLVLSKLMTSITLYWALRCRWCLQFCNTVHPRISSSLLLTLKTYIKPLLGPSYNILIYNLLENEVFSALSSSKSKGILGTTVQVELKTINPAH